MFLLTVIPLHLMADSDNKARNTQNQLDVQEHQVMELEALYTSLILNQYYGEQVEGVNSYELDNVRATLDQARADELSMRDQESGIADNNSVARLSYVTYMKQVADQRVQDLQTLSTSIENGEQLGYIVSGVDNESQFAVQKELERAVAYQQELDRSVSFWQEVATLQNLAITEAEENEEEEEVVFEPALDDYEWDDPRSEIIATSKRNIAELQSLLSRMSSNKSIDQLKLEESSIKGQLSKEIINVKYENSQGEESSGNSTNTAANEVSSLQSQLRVNRSQQEIAKLINGVGNSVQQEITAHMQNLL